LPLRACTLARYAAVQCRVRSWGVARGCGLSCIHTWQFVYCGKKATLSIGNIKPVGELPEGTIICNVEEVSTRLVLLCHLCCCCWCCPNCQCDDATLSCSVAKLHCVFTVCC
jgi:hypothetical protein